MVVPHPPTEPRSNAIAVPDVPAQHCDFSQGPPSAQPSAKTPAAIRVISDEIAPAVEAELSFEINVRSVPQSGGVMRMTLAQLKQ
jgi:P pilus assembly chaperone PapD